METSYMEAIAHFIVEARWEALPEQVRRAGKRVFLDVLGANVRGSEEPENVRLGEFFEQMSGSNRTSTLLRAGFPLVDRFSAAFVNGTQAPSTELDDGFRHATAHSGAYVMSGALALAEALDSSAVDMLTAFIVGYDIASRAALGARVPKLVIMQHGVLSALGTAAAACVLKRYDAAATKEVLRIAASFAHVTSYSVLPQGATIRNVWCGAGARDGLLAAELAAMGFLGLNDAIRITLERVAPVFDEAQMTRDLGKVYCITQNYHKQYACNGNFDASIEAILNIVRQNDIAPEEIERILVEVYAPFHTLDEARPRNPLAAKFSLRYTVAAAAVCRHANHEAFTADKLADPVIMALTDRTFLREDPSLAASLPLIRPSRVTVLLQNGRKLVKLVENPRGHYQNPFTDKELEAKFAHLAGRYLTEKGVNSVRDCIKNPEKAASVRMITDAMRDHAKSSS